MKTTTALTVLMCLLSLGCSGQIFSDGPSEVERDVADLGRKLQELERQTTIDQVEIERLRQKVAALEARAASAPRSTAPPAAQARGLEEEEVPPPRQVEVIEIADLEEPLEPEPSTPTETGSGQPSGLPKQPSGLPVSAAAQTLYDRGYSLYHQGRHSQAEETFERFLVEFAETDLGDNAQYWIGECRLARQDDQGALHAFRETLRQYPQGNKTPDALLKAGVVLERTGDREAARVSYEEVLRRFPDSPAGAQAAERLNFL